MKQRSHLGWVATSTTRLTELEVLRRRQASSYGAIYGIDTQNDMAYYAIIMFTLL
jgi:hypothetical protein